VHLFIVHANTTKFFIGLVSHNDYRSEYVRTLVNVAKIANSSGKRVVI
jgi:hypothetical protein